MSSWAPLAGMPVVEACQRLVGPLAAWQLSLLGAEVTKVEPPAGDVARGWGAVFDLMSARKRCAALNLNHPAGRAAFERLCAAADIVLADATWSEQARRARRHPARRRAHTSGGDRRRRRCAGGLRQQRNPCAGGTGDHPLYWRAWWPTGTTRRRCRLGLCHHMRRASGARRLACGGRHASTCCPRRD